MTKGDVHKVAIWLFVNKGGLMKKYQSVSLICLLLGISLIIVGTVLNYNQSNKPINQIPNDDFHNSYTYIKTHDIQKRTRVKFLLIDNSKPILYANDEYNRLYVNEEEKFYTDASIFETDASVEDFYNNSIDIYRKELKNENITIKTKSIQCDYLCYQIDLLRDNTLIEESLYIYISTSEKDLGIINYYFKNGTFSPDLIEKLISSILIDYDAKYNIGNVEDNKTTIILEDQDEHKKVRFSLDVGNYREVENEVNTFNTTTVLNIKNNYYTMLKMYSRKVSDDILVDIEKSYECKNKEKVILSNRSFYKYQVEDKNLYAYVINDNNAILIITKDDITETDDLVNFTIT